MYTLDPEAKYSRPKPSISRTLFYSSLTNVDAASAAALPNAAIQSTSTAPNGEKYSGSISQQSAIASKPAMSVRKPQSSGSPTKRMLLATFCKMRVTRSAGFNEGSVSKSEQQPNPEQPISEVCRAQSTRLAPTDNDFHVPAAKFSVTKTTQSLMTSVEEHRDGMPVLQVLDGLPLIEQMSSLSLGLPNKEATLSVAIGKNSRTSNVFYSALEPLREDNTAFEEAWTDSRRLSSASATIEPSSMVNTRQTDAVDVQVMQGVNVEPNLPYDEIYYGAQSCLGSDSSSYTTSNLFSPGLAPGSIYTDGMSPYHLAQPDTPSVSEFGGDYLETRLVSDSEPNVTLPTVRGTKDVRIESASNLLHIDYPEFEGFQGYGLSEAEQASALTLRRFPSNTLESSGGGSTFGNQGSKDLIHSWNDGSEHRITALEELVDDLGYLGELIV